MFSNGRQNQPYQLRCLYMLVLIWSTVVLFALLNLWVDDSSGKVLYPDDIYSFSVYFDRRPRQSFMNATVVLVSVVKHLVDNIVGCEIDGVHSTNIIFREIQAARWINNHFGSLTHTDCILYCHDMKVNPNSTINILFKITDKEMKAPVNASVLIPEEGPEKDEVMVCATGFGSPVRLDEWLVYQKTIGVTFIHMSIHESFMSNFQRSSVLSYYWQTGYVSVLLWEEHLDKTQVFYYNQIFKYLDCLYRYQYRYKYMMVYDFDEFLNPVGAIRDVHSFAKLVFEREEVFWSSFIGKRKLGSVLLPEKVYYCPLNDSIFPSDGNITEWYDTSQFHAGQGKSIHLVSAVMELTAHGTYYVFFPYQYFELVHVSDKSLANSFYISHISHKPHHTRTCKATKYRSPPM